MDFNLGQTDMCMLAGEVDMTEIRHQASCKHVQEGSINQRSGKSKVQASPSENSGPNQCSSKGQPGRRNHQVRPLLQQQQQLLLLTASPHILSPLPSSAPFNTSPSSPPFSGLAGSLPCRSRGTATPPSPHAQHDGKYLPPAALSCFAASSSLETNITDQLASFPFPPPPSLSLYLCLLHHLRSSVGVVGSWLLCCKDLAREATRTYIHTWLSGVWSLIFFFGCVGVLRGNKKTRHKREEAWK